MAGNPERRAALADAGIAVLARGGVRALTHRAVDETARVPPGTAANYWRSRDALIGGLFLRITERLGADESEVDGIDGEQSDLRAEFRALFRRLTADPELGLAYLSLRLDAAHHSEVRRVVEPLVRGRFATALGVFAPLGGPGNEPLEIVATHYLVVGAAFDALTVSVAPGLDPEAALDRIADALVLAYDARSNRSAS